MSKVLIKMVVLNSLHKVYHDDCPKSSKTEWTTLNKEPFSFQIAYKTDGKLQNSVSFYPTIETDLPISLYNVGNVPVLEPYVEKLTEHHKPGLFPDMLLPKIVNPKIIEVRNKWNCYNVEKNEKTMLHSFSQSWQSLWITVNESGKKLPVGKHDITIKFHNRDKGELIGQQKVSVEVIAADLPKQKLYCTNWFHCDCLADTYGVEIFSERFFEIFRSYAKMAALNGMNMILTPAFTPPLDTPIGGERMTAQLVGVEKCGDNYKFDFSLLKRYIDESKKCGIEYFEHSHLFTQWGARNAPKVVAVENGKKKQLFGWNTKASGKKYSTFLRAYLKALQEFLKNEGLSKKMLFHISDEPFPSMHKDYCAAKATIADLLKGYMTGDALSHYEFYEDGTVETPIVVTSSVEDFAGKCDNLWCYYTGDQIEESYSNRLIVNSSERNRMLGVQMYVYNIKGFLNWAYNFYYDVLSQGLYDPKIFPSPFRGTNPGAAFLVYPACDGTAIQSIRQKVFYEGINDMRALQLLEKLQGREATMKLVEKYFGKVTFNTPAKSIDNLMNFRNAVNQEIKRCV